jgi:predicted Zn-dependent peptidase
LESTGAQASAALSRRFYRPAHPSYTPAPQDNLDRLQQISLDEVTAYHTAHFGANDLQVVFVGDVDDAAIDSAVTNHLGTWESREVSPRYDDGAHPEEPGRSEVPMPDKSNVDVRMGHPMTIRRDHEDFIPLHVGNFILGGNFSARLMNIIRDEMGLTYGIRSSLSGFSIDHEGYWQVSVTLSQENLTRGIEATMDVVRQFVETGVTQDELEEKQTTLTGAFKVGLATTGGLASAILRNLERDFGAAYLDRFPEEIKAVDLTTVNRVIQTYCDPARFHQALAGTLDGAV